MTRDPTDPLPDILKFQDELRSAREQVATLVRDKARLVDQGEILAGRHADEPDRIQRRWNATESALSAAQAHLAELESQRPAICKRLVALRLAELLPDYQDVRLNFSDLSIRYRALKAAYGAWSDTPDPDPIPALAANPRNPCSENDALAQEQQRLKVMGIDPAILSLMPAESPL